MKAVVDIDVFTIALWDKQDDRKEHAEEVLKKIENGEIELHIPLLLFQQIHEWKHGDLATRIAEFQFKHSKELIDVRELENSIESETGKLVSEIIEEGMDRLENMNESDLNLVLYVSGLKLGHLITFDKKHLLNRQKELNKFLKEQELTEIEIKSPEELSS
ncbi:MAG: hypothetical protein ABEJ56_03475 [Candidatus Nanohaloarchaea archaeon]